MTKTKTFLRVLWMLFTTGFMAWTAVWSFFLTNRLVAALPVPRPFWSVMLRTLPLFIAGLSAWKFVLEWPRWWGLQKQKDQEKLLDEEAWYEKPDKEYR